MNPVKLIKLEILKYKDNSLIQMLLLFYTLMMPIVIFVLKNFESLKLPGIDNFFSFPKVWDYQAYIGSWLTFMFFGFLGVYIITSEIQFKTMRQNIITGLTRFEFFISKILIAILVSLYATIIFYLSTILIGVIDAGEFNIKDIMANQHYVFLRFYFLTFAYMTFGIFVAFLIRKPALSIFFYFMYILLIEPLFRWMVHIKYISKGRSFLFYPMNGIEDLAPLPSFKYIDNFNGLKNFPILMTYSEAAIISFISVIAFIFFSYLLLTKRDL